MRSLLSLGAVAVAVPFALLAACATPVPSAREADGGTTTSATEHTQGPLSGTYSADSTAGTAPFAAVTFTDAQTFEYVTKDCVAGSVTEGEDQGETSDDDSGDAGAEDACIHTGTYAIEASVLKLTDLGSGEITELPLEPISADGSEVGYPSDEAATAALVVGAAALFGALTVNQLSVGGTAFRRTGLVDGTGTLASPGSSGADASATPGASGGSLLEPSDGGTALLTDQAVALGQKWVDVKMPYCQAVNGGKELSAACIRLHGSTCNRTGSANSSAWNAYRSDCSGFVSYTWSLPAPGLTTRGFVPGAAKYVPVQDLAPGDALLRPGRHIVLFKEWTDKKSGKAKVLAEPGCSAKGGPYAQEQSWSLGKPGAGTSTHASGGTYYAIRKK